ncbi:hypothetical protein DQ04_00121160 [Trypanosoma grayi]|uniref:hypothetical protein n=1 Tax=Trypanosoma grayi TaxID=71804 RepID=UPI0004F46385|nr:hypothetical protein DQ04_00121160 [Trypanosoma grayi]KEG15284.1 hypothetical protein DQ04_00121160 [Trypanosoma grayi]
MSVEARLYHVEQQAKQIGQQVELLKQLITTEVLDLRKGMEQEVAEVKKVVMYQDRLYQERIDKLEERIQQLSDFCLHLARSNGYMGPAVVTLPVDSVTPPSIPEYSPPKESVSYVDKNTTSAYDEGDDEDERTKSVEGVLQKYKNRMDAIYGFYTTSSIDVFHPTMTMTHFSRFVKDCQLCGLSQGTSAELLWMAVMRSLNVKQNKRLTQAKGSAKNRDITLGNNTSTREKKNLFAYQRLETIPKHLFGESLYILSKVKHRQRQISEGGTLNGEAHTFPLDEKPEETLLTFLLYHIFPYVDAIMGEKHGSQSFVSELGGNQDDGAADLITLGEATTITEYKSDAVKAVVQNFLGYIKDCFTLAIRTTQGYHSTVMNLDGFVEVARRYELLPLIRKPLLRQIFLSCSTLEKEKHPDALEETLSVGTFVLALYHLAERIYGDTLMARKFPTPESRMKKLLTKMFLLN